MPKQQALRAATSEAAAFLGRPELGSLRPARWRIWCSWKAIRWNASLRDPLSPGRSGGVCYRPRNSWPSQGRAARFWENEPWARRAAAQADGQERPRRRTGRILPCRDRPDTGLHPTRFREMQR